MKKFFYLISFLFFVSHTFAQKEPAQQQPEPPKAPLTAFDYNRRAQSRIEFGDFNGAIQDYTNAIALTPSDVKLYANRGLAKVEMKDDKGALYDYDMAIAMDSTFVRALNCRGTLFLDEKRYKEAFNDFDKALKQQPNYANAIINRGLARQALNDSIGACNDWNLASTFGKSRANELLKRYCK